MKHLNFHKVIALVGLVLWAVETAYFGFNKESQSGAESLLDNISFILIGWGILGDLLNGISISKSIKTDTIVVEDANFVVKNTNK